MITRTQTYWLAALVAGDLFLGAVCFGFLPNQSPVHWNVYGEVDRYGGRFEVALLMPIMIVFMAGIVVLLANFTRAGDGLQRSGATPGRIAIVIVATLIVIHATLLLSAFGRPIDVPRVLTANTGLLLMALGNWMGKCRPNKFVGIRTPWTLKSDVTWERTHRLGGRLQVVHGLAVLLAALLLPLWVAMSILLGGLLAITAWAMIYSWSIYRQTAAETPSH